MNDNSKANTVTVGSNHHDGTSSNHHDTHETKVKQPSSPPMSPQSPKSPHKHKHSKHGNKHGHHDHKHKHGHQHHKHKDDKAHSPPTASRIPGPGTGKVEAAAAAAGAAASTTSPPSPTSTPKSRIPSLRSLKHRDDDETNDGTNATNTPKTPNTPNTTTSQKTTKKIRTTISPTISPEQMRSESLLLASSPSRPSPAGGVGSTGPQPSSPSFNKTALKIRASSNNNNINNNDDGGDDGGGKHNIPTLLDDVNGMNGGGGSIEEEYEIKVAELESQLNAIHHQYDRVIEERAQLFELCEEQQLTMEELKQEHEMFKVTREKEWNEMTSELDTLRSIVEEQILSHREEDDDEDVFDNDQDGHDHHDGEREEASGKEHGTDDGVSTDNDISRDSDGDESDDESDGDDDITDDGHDDSPKLTAKLQENVEIMVEQVVEIDALKQELEKERSKSLALQEKINSGDQTDEIQKSIGQQEHRSEDKLAIEKQAKTIEELQQAQKLSESEMSDLKRRLDEVQTLFSEKETLLKNEIAEKDVIVENDSKKIDELVEKSKKDTALIKSLNEKLQEINTKCDKLSQTHHEENRKYEDQIENLAKANSTLVAKLDTLEESNVNSSEGKEDLPTKQADTESPKQHDLQSEIEQLKSQLASQQEVFDAKLEKETYKSQIASETLDLMVERFSSLQATVKYMMDRNLNPLETSETDLVEA